MDVEYELTTGACARITQANMDDPNVTNYQPVVQFLSIKKLPSNKPDTPDRYRLIVSDGKHFVQAMLATQLNQLIENESIKKHTVAVLEKYTSNVVQSKRLVIVLALRVIGDAPEKIGMPESLEGTVKVNNAEPAAGSSAPVVQPKAQAQATHAARPNKTNERATPIFPIEALSPFQNKWTIKARVTQKSDIKHYSNQKGEGKFFNVTFMDETGEIKGTAFNAVVDELYDRLEEGKVYFISRARVNIAKRKFSNVDNQYELSLERATEIEECLDTADLPMVKYNFVPLKDLESVTKDSIIDVIGVVREAHELGEVISKSTQKTIPKRDLTLVDTSKFSVRLTLWGEQAKKYTATDHPVIAVKGVKVGDFGGKSLSMISSSTMSVNPDILDAHALKGWFESSGSQADFQSHSISSGGAGIQSGGVNLSELKTTQEVKDMNLGADKPEYFSSRVIITHIRTENIMYPACLSENCNKKVTDLGDGWKCEKCERTFDRPEYRYLVTFCGADHTGQLWLQGFNDVGVIVFGMSANELKDLEDQDREAYDSAVKRVISRVYNVACRAKQDTYNDMTRVRYGINRIVPLDFTDDTKQVLDLLSAYA